MTEKRWLNLALAFALSAFSATVSAGDGVVALQTADSSCADDFIQGKRFVDCGNGTVTDNLTGLVWLANASCLGLLDWHEAMAAVAGLGDLPDGEVCGALSADDCDCGLSDGSSPGEWRLATIGEWKTMVEDAAAMNCNPTITSDQGNDCWDQQCVDTGSCSFYGVQPWWYWSSSSSVPTPAGAWGVGLNFGGVFGSPKGSFHYVWPVRGGQ